MKITHAVWEKRNLGKDTMEFEVEPADPLEETVKTILENEKQYNVVKVPVGDLQLNRALCENGYVYIESMMKIINDFSGNSVSPIQQRICDEISYDVMNSDDLNELFRELKKGIFKTDRIAIDPEFSVETANKRYENWIRDEIERGTTVFKELYHNEVINFFLCRKISGNIYSPFLGGTYEKYINKGIGIPCMLKSVEICRAIGAKRLVSSVSTNNPAALRGNLTVGYRVEDVKHVFVKHNK